MEAEEALTEGQVPTFLRPFLPTCLRQQQPLELL